LEVGGTEARLTEVRKEALVAGGEGARFGPALGHAHDEEAPALGVRALVEQARDLAFEAAHVGEFAQPLCLARELTVAGFIRGSLDERVGNHALFVCLWTAGGSKRRACVSQG